MRFRLLAVLAFAAATFAGNAGAQEGDAAAGEAKARVCVTCHGPTGNSTNPEWPKLAGQHARYLFLQLQAFKAGSRANPLMTPMAARLSEQDMLDLAAYFAAQKPR